MADQDERDVIGTCIHWPELVPELRERLSSDDFRLAETARAFRAMEHVTDRGEPAILTNVCRELRMTGASADLRSGALLVEWTENVPTPTFLRWQAVNVIRAAQRRRLASAGTQVSVVAQNPAIDSDAAVQQAQQIIGAVSRVNRAPTRLLDPEDMALFAAERNLEAEMGEQTVLPLGWADLDHELIGGIRPGQLVVVGGRPGMGKSAFLRAIARQVGQTAHVLFASNEMTEHQIAVRDVAVISGVGIATVLSGKWTSGERQALYEAENAIARTGLHTLVDASMTAATLRARAIELDGRVGLSCIVVDYLQRMQGQGKTSLERVGANARALKSLALELDVPVVVGSQLSRGNEREAEKRPQLIDLRESGEIEQEADVVLLLFREGYYRDDVAQNVAEVRIAKQRQGPAGVTVKLAWLSSLATFRNLAKV